MTMTIGEIRAHVQMVADRVGRPKGVAPSIQQYKVHCGDMCPKTLMALVSGYRAPGKPTLGWVACMEALGFTSARKWRGERKRFRYEQCPTCRYAVPVPADTEMEATGQYVAEGVLS